MVMNKSELLSLKGISSSSYHRYISIRKTCKLTTFCKYGRWLILLQFILTEENSPISIIEHTLTKGSNYFVDCSKVNEKINNTCAFLEDVFYHL